jgi:hypothetical protein
VSVFTDIEAAVVTALTASPALAGGHVLRGRDLPVPTTRAEQVDVSLANSRGQGRTLDGAYNRWATAVVLRLRARASAGQGGTDAVDALLTATFARLAAATPPAGIARWTLEPDIEWSVDEADQTLVEARLLLRVDHFTGAALAAAT